MADQRITQLTALAKGDVAATDVLPIVDVGASQTKKVTAKDLVGAGLDLVDNGEIDLSKLDQTSTTKLGTVSLADDAITAAKLADDSSVAYESVEPTTNNFQGRGYVNSTSKYLKVYDGAAYQQVIAPTAGIEDLAVTTGKLANNAVTTAKVDAAGLGAAALATDSVSTVKIQNSAVTTDKLNALSVTEAKVATDAISTDKIVNNAVTYAKLQQTSGTNVLLGRSTAGAGNVEEITCTGAGRDLLDDADAAAQRTTLGLGTIATQAASSVVITGGTVAGLTSLTTATSTLGNATITSGSITGITDLAIADGGTGASDAATARTNLGVEIGTDVQAYDAGLNSIAGLITTSDQTIYTTAEDTYAATALTVLGRDLIGSANASAGRTVLDLGTISTQNANSVAITGGTVEGLTSLTTATSTLGNATITSGSITGITDLAVADGGTGASDAATARTNLGVAIGSDVQAYDAGLNSIAGLTTSADQTIYATGSDTYATTSLTSFGRSLIDDADAATARTTLELGTLATQSGTFSGTHSGTTSGTNTGDQTITLTGDVTGSGTGSFAATIANDAVTTAKIADANVTTDLLADDAVTGAKLADDSSTVVDTTDPAAPGAFVGQQWINANTGLTRIWDGTNWIDSKGVQAITFSDTTPITFAVTYPTSTSATVTTTLDTQAAASVFAGPASGANAAPTFRALQSTDLPIAATGVVGAVSPGTGLSVDGSGVLNHLNSVTAGTFTKVTVDAQGHVTTGANLLASDVPNLDASKITTGTFGTAFLAANSVTAEQLADYGIAQVSETAPTPEFAGQWWINPSDRSAYIWVGTVAPVPNGYWLLVGYGSPTQLNLRFGGTYNASTNTVVTLNQYGTEAGLTVGQALGAPNSQNNGVYLIVTTAGTGTTPAPTVSLAAGDWVLSQGTGANWTKVAVVSGATGTFNDYDILCDGTYFTPDMTGVTDVRDALTLLWGRAQIATTSQIGVVLESTEVLVNNSTGEMTIGVVDDGTY
jgi:hypothetical protein